MQVGKLGKSPPKYDPRTLQFEAYTAHPITVPPSISWGSEVRMWPVYLNDTIGDCTIASLGHLIQDWSTRASTPIKVPDSAVLAAYKAVSGYDGSPATDRGAAILDTLNYFRRTGVGGRKIVAYTALEPSNTTHVREGVFLFGGIDIGLALPVSAQAQAGPGKVWSVVPGPSGAPGSWGGHCVPVMGFNKDVLTCVSWGFVQYMTWNFYLRYCDEAYAPVSSDWLNFKGVSPSGFNLADLMSDLKEIA